MRNVVTMTITMTMLVTMTITEEAPGRRQRQRLACEIEEARTDNSGAPATTRVFTFNTR